MSKRSFINAISNTAHLPDLDHVPLIQILKRQFPLETLLSCLHELTHHWCFDSAIGLAHSLIYADAIHAMFQSTTKSEQTIMARERFVQFSVIDAALDPLYEGLALFAEQNLASLETEAASQPFVVAGTHYGVAVDDQFVKAFSALLVRCRRTITNVKRKAEMLSLPGDPGRSPYLSGYMTVLGGFYRVAARTVAFRDPDFFFIYFKSFFFDDLEFATVLLSLDVTPEQYADNVHSYIRTRVLRFMMMDHTKNAVELSHRLQGTAAVRASIGGDPIGEDYVSLENSREGHRLGQDLLNRKFQTLMREGISGSEISDTVRLLLSHMIANRSFLRLLCRRVWIKNLEGAALLFETERDYSEADRGESTNGIRLPATSELPDGPAFLECICVRLWSRFVLRKADGSEPGEVLTVLGPPLEGVSEFPRFSHSAFDKWARVVDPLLPTRDQRDLDHIEKMRSLIGASSSRLFDVFSPALMFHHDHSHPVSEEFLKQGFLGVMEERSLVKAATCISILSFQAVPDELRVTSIVEYWEWLMSIGEVKGTLKENIEDLLRIRDRSGWKVLASVNDQFALALSF